MTNKLAKATKAPPLAVDSPAQYMIGFDETDLTFPEYRVANSMSQAVKDGDVKPGVLYCPQNGDQRGEIKAVVLIARKTRTLWQETGNAPWCWSFDNFQAAPNSAFEGQECKGCKYRLDAPWQVSAEERRKFCTPGYTYLCYDLDNKVPFLVRLNGAAVNGGKHWSTTITSAFGSLPFQAITLFTVKERQGKFGSFWQIVPRVVGPLPDEQASYWGTIAMKLLAQEKEIDWGVGSGSAEDDSTPTAPKAGVAAHIPDDSDLPF